MTSPKVMCVVCGFSAWVENLNPTVGTPLYRGTASNFLRDLRRYLTLLGKPRAEAYTLKCFRAGRATAMARAGATWQTLQSAGEWKGMSCLPYIAPEAIDQYSAVQAVLEASSDEGEP